MIKEIDFQSTLESAFLAYGASVAQERAIPDVRDGLKIGLRQGLYAQYSNGLTAKDKYQKAQKSVAAAMAQSYVHGDVAMYDTFIRAAKPWAYRYPIEDAQGAVGSPSSPDDHSAARYVEMRSAKLADYFFTGLKKEAVKEWYDNYDDTEKIPSVFPSIGFWNVVNGSSGIAVAMVTSVPQFNLREVNEALIKIIKDKEVQFDSIYCVPDFATGGFLINPTETKEGMRKGEGVSIKLRANLEYFPKEHMIKASELPYGVYTNVIMKQLADIANNDELYGIKKVIDHTKKEADIRIYLSKDADAEKMKRKLYADTSLEDSYLINMVMLDQGRFPKVFGWREACDAYIEHIRSCKYNEIEYDYNKALARKNILSGLIMAAANIDDIVKVIRGSADQKEAAKNLIAKYSFNKEQVEAILAMKLSSLTKIDGVKIKEESLENDKFIASCRHLLDTPSSLDEVLINILKEVSNKYGDNRRTKVLEKVEAKIEEDEEKEVYVNFYNNSTLKVSVAEDKKDNTLVKSVKSSTNSIISIFTDTGRYFSTPVSSIKFNSQDSLYKYFKIESHENIIWRGVNNEFSEDSWFVFISEDGMVKKTSSSEYLTIKSKNGTIGCKLKEGIRLDSIVLSSDVTDKIFIVSNSGNYVMYEQGTISSVGRVASGVKGIKLTNTEKVFYSRVFNGIAEVVTFASSGKGKRTSIEDFPETSRAVKGNAIMKLSGSESIKHILLVPSSESKIAIEGKTVLLKDIPIRTRLAAGKKIL